MLENKTNSEFKDLVPFTPEVFKEDNPLVKFDAVEHSYQRINWQDGVTPLSAENLNKMDIAIDVLIKDSGYIPQAIDDLNVEYNYRIADSKKLNKNINIVDSNLRTEADLRKTADTELQKNIDDEATARQEADDTLKGQINTEVTNRTNTDAELRTAISTEATVRETNDNSLFASIAGHETRISNLEKYDTVVRGSLSKLDNSRANHETRITTLEGKVAVLEGAEEIPDNILTSDDKLILQCGTSTTVLH